MKLLLTSAGVKNKSIEDALVDLLGKPIPEAAALCVPTAAYPISNGAEMAHRIISGSASTPMTELGWKSVGVLELTALPTIGEDVWVSSVRRTDALLVGGGDPLYLAYWMRGSGLADLFPSLHDTVYLGVSAGSVIMAASVGEDFVEWRPPTGGDETLGIVPFSIFPHLDHPDLPENTMADAERWAKGMSQPCYAIDDDTAIRVIGDEIEVISEGHWKLFEQE